MKACLLLLCALVPFACSRDAKQEAKIPSFSYQGEYYPSFMAPCTISIVAKGKSAHLWLSVFQYRDTVTTLSFATSAALSPADLAFFFAKLDRVPVLRMGTKEQIGTDGITVYNTVSQDSLTNKFKFWSPRKASAPQEHKLVEAVLGLCQRKFTAPQQQVYLESLEQYFDFGLPCKVTSTEPFEVRLYGSLSSDEEQDLTRFVRALPTAKPILIDVTNFEGMGTMYFPLFRRLLVQNTRIVWVASEWSRKQLWEMGVPASRITRTIAAGRALIRKLGSSSRLAFLGNAKTSDRPRSLGSGMTSSCFQQANTSRPY
jgi:hypothetical protein